jgi:hypothetical protein
VDIKGTISGARINPIGPLKDAGIEMVVVALFSVFTCQHLSLPNNSIAVTYAQHPNYHGALHGHPAASFCVRVNVDGATALRGLFKGGAEKGAEAIVKSRAQGCLACFDNLQTILEGVSATLWDDAESLCIFFQ